MKLTTETIDDYMKDPILTKEQAHDCIQYFGYNGFHFHRQYPERYSEYSELHIDSFEIMRWRLEDLSIIYNKIMDKSFEEISNKDIYEVISLFSIVDHKNIQLSMKYMFIKCALFNIDETKNSTRYLVSKILDKENGYIVRSAKARLTETAQVYLDITYHLYLSNNELLDKNRIKQDMAFLSQEYSLIMPSKTKLEIYQYLKDLYMENANHFREIDFNDDYFNYINRTVFDKHEKQSDTKISDKDRSSFHLGQYSNLVVSLFKKSKSNLNDNDYTLWIELFCNADENILINKGLLFLMLRFYFSNNVDKQKLFDDIVGDDSTCFDGFIKIIYKSKLDKHVHLFVAIADYCNNDLYNKKDEIYKLNILKLNNLLSDLQIRRKKVFKRSLKNLEQSTTYKTRLIFNKNKSSTTNTLC